MSTKRRARLHRIGRKAQAKLFLDNAKPVRSEQRLVDGQLVEFTVVALPSAKRSDSWEGSGAPARMDLTATAARRKGCFGVACPVCKQPAGSPCLTRGGEQARTHTLRRQRAKSKR